MCVCVVNVQHEDLLFLLIKRCSCTRLLKVVITFVLSLTLVYIYTCLFDIFPSLKRRKSLSVWGTHHTLLACDLSVHRQSIKTRKKKSHPLSQCWRVTRHSAAAPAPAASSLVVFKPAHIYNSVCVCVCVYRIIYTQPGAIGSAFLYIL